MDGTAKADDWTQLQGLVAQTQNTHKAEEQTDGGMSQLLAIAGLHSQFNHPNMMQQSRLDLQEANRWRYNSSYTNTALA